MLKFRAEPCAAGDLEPGDLVSTVGQEYWGELDPDVVAAKVYICTGTPSAPGDAETRVYRIHTEVR